MHMNLEGYYVPEAEAAYTVTTPVRLLNGNIRLHELIELLMTLNQVGNVRVKENDEAVSISFMLTRHGIRHSVIQDTIGDPDWIISLREWKE